ncbi:DUF4232 domain-containing protein [Streptomyces sp. NPDC003035]|uniref:DUF4232 domain-containing protein n=1 Tax=Streptomyces sp. NPDC003035 TaxID=3364676 RepID=UPI0036886E3D
MKSAACTHRKSPRGWKYAIGAAVVAALLGSTACRSDTAGGSDATRPSGRSSATNSAKPVETAPSKPGGTASPKPGGTSGTPGGNGGSGPVAACAAADLAVSAVKEPADSKEARHLLITVQNAGDEKCDLYHYPLVRLGADARTTVPVIKDSDPDPGKPVTLAPGKEAYAALLVSGGARDEYEAHTVSLRLQGRTPGSNASKPMDVPLPVKTLYADDGQLVTYWTTASGYALDFIMSK